MLRIHEVAIELVGEVMPLMREIERVDPDLARQGRRAVTSVPLNIAEGSDQCGKRRMLHYRVALGGGPGDMGGSSGAHAARYLAAPSAELTNKVNQVIGTLHRCIYKPS